MKTNQLTSIPRRKRHGPTARAFWALGSALALTISAPASAVEGRWIEGFGQGNLEFFVDAKGMRLYIGCLAEEGSHSYIALYPITGGAAVPTFDIQVDGSRFKAPFETSSRVGSNNFHELLQALRTSPATVTYRGKKIVFPATGAAQAIPEGPTATVCQTS